MCRKVHFRAADIPSPCLCSRRCFLSTYLSLSLLSEKHILGPLHFLKNTFFYSNALLRNEMRILPFEISFGICPHPSQLLPALEHFCQKSPGEKEISPGFDLRFKLLHTEAQTVNYTYIFIDQFLKVAAKL